MNIVIKQPDYPTPQGEMAFRQIGTITDLIVHHSAGAPSQTPLEIDAEHRAEGWDMIGYSFVIGEDGTIYRGRGLNYVPAAAYGRNAQSVDVCLTGNFQPNTAGYSGEPTAAQMNSLRELSLYLHKTVPSICRTIGHRDVAPMFFPNDEGDYSTDCPGENCYRLLPELRAFVSQNLKKL